MPIIVVVPIAFAGCQDGSPTRHEEHVAEEAAATLGMDVYVVREPFLIYVAKGFPHDDGSFNFTHPPSEIQLSVADGGVDRKRTITLSLGDNVSLDIDYEPKAADSRNATNLMFTRDYPDRQEFLLDFNADGTFDKKMARDGLNGQRTSRPHEIWLRGQWRPVGENLGGGQHVKLVSGEEVVFDMDRGVWETTCN